MSIGDNFEFRNMESITKCENGKKINYKSNHLTNSLYKTANIRLN